MPVPPVPFSLSTHPPTWSSSALVSARLAPSGAMSRSWKHLWQPACRGAASLVSAAGHSVGRSAWVDAAIAAASRPGCASCYCLCATCKLSPKQPQCVSSTHAGQLRKGANKARAGQAHQYSTPSLSSSSKNARMRWNATSSSPTASSGSTRGGKSLRVCCRQGGTCRSCTQPHARSAVPCHRRQSQPHSPPSAAFASHGRCWVGDPNMSDPSARMVCQNAREKRSLQAQDAAGKMRS